MVQREAARLAAALAAAESGGRLVDLIGPPGCGRTLLLAELAKRLAAGDPECVVAGAELRQRAREADGARALAEFEILLLGLGRQIDGAADALSRAAPLNLADGDTGIRLRAFNLGMALAGAVAGHAPQPLYVLLDDAGLPSGDLANWVDELLANLVREGATAVVTRDGTAAPRSWSTRSVLRHSFDWRVTTDEIRQLLEGRASSDLVEVIARWSGGYPPAVDIAVACAGSASTPEELEHELDTPDRDALDTLSPAFGFVERADEPLRAAIEIAASLRSFDLEAVESIHRRLRADDPAEPDLPDSFEATFERLPFVTRGADGLEFAGFVRALIASDLTTRGDAGRERFPRIHRNATNFYLEQLETTFDEQRGEMYGWKALESGTWQEQALCFAYHAVRVPKSTSWRRLQIAKIYFDFFWWWGWYLKSPVAARLLGIWERFQPKGEESSRELLHQLRRFEDSYVRAGELWLEPDADVTTRWQAAQDALVEIRRILELEEPALDDEERTQKAHLLGITSSLLGDALRGLGQPDSADESYTDAHLAFTRVVGLGLKTDNWCIPWTLYFRADALLARKPDDAARLAREALSLAGTLDYVDHELIANSRRLLGDVDFMRDPSHAFGEYVHAVFEAYAFQVKPPDEYTRLFLREQLARVLHRLRELDPEQARQICVELESYGLGSAAAGEAAALLAAGAWSELMLALFPREPADDELVDGPNEPAYVEHARSVCDSFSARQSPALSR